jgi:hypothetical protein
LSDKLITFQKALGAMKKKKRKKRKKRKKKKQKKNEHVVLFCLVRNVLVGAKRDQKKATASQLLPLPLEAVLGHFSKTTSGCVKPL